MSIPWIFCSVSSSLWSTAGRKTPASAVWKQVLKRISCGVNLLPVRRCHSSLGRETNCLYSSSSRCTENKTFPYSLALPSNSLDPTGESSRLAALAARAPSRPWWGVAAARLSLYRSLWQVRTYLRRLALLAPLLPPHLSRCTFIFCWHVDIRAIRQHSLPFPSPFSPFFPLSL